VADLYFLRPIVASMAQTQNEEEIEPSQHPLCIYIVPFVSLITEKEAKITPLLQELGLKSISIHSHKRAILSTTEPPDVVLCTI